MIRDGGADLEDTEEQVVQGPAHVHGEALNRPRNQSGDDVQGPVDPKHQVPGQQDHHHRDLHDCREDQQEFLGDLHAACFPLKERTERARVVQ